MFNLNPSMDIKTFKHKGRGAVIIDDFYTNPDEIRKFAKSQPLQGDESLCSGFPGSRVFKKDERVKYFLYDLFYNLALDNDIWDRQHCIDINHFNRSWDSVGFMVNVLNDKSLIKDPLGIVPHQDAYTGVREPGLPNFQFGANIYLNTPNECAGGTAWYSFDGEISIPKREVSGIPIPDNADELSNKEIFNHVKEYTLGPRWKLEHEFEMVYNRMVMYEADVLHGQSVDLGMFTDYNRMNQVIFM